MLPQEAMELIGLGFYIMVILLPLIGWLGHWVAR